MSSPFFLSVILSHHRYTIVIARAKELYTGVSQVVHDLFVCDYRRAGAMTNPMTSTSGVGHSQRCPDMSPLNLVQRVTSSCSLQPSTSATSAHPHSHTIYQRLQQPTSLVTSSAGASSASKPRCFECSLCGKRFKVSGQDSPSSSHYTRLQPTYKTLIIM